MPITTMFEMMAGAIVFTLSLIWNIRSYHSKNLVLQIITTLGIVAGIVLFVVCYVYSKN